MNMLQYDLALYNNMNVTGRFNIITWFDILTTLSLFERIECKKSIEKNNKTFWRHNKLMTKQLTNEQRIEIICLP